MTALAILLASLAAANAYEDTFAGANAAYNAGNYPAAIQMYEQLVSEGVAHPAVFFNLGNAYYRGGRQGSAIANYERALQLDPGMDNARQNLAKAVQDTQRHLARPLPPEWFQSLFFWHYALSSRATNTLALFFWFVLWATLAVRQWHSVRYTRRVAVVAAVLAFAFGISAWDKAHPMPLAVANQEVVPVHYGTNENETVRFELYAGDRVTVDKRVDGWARVTTVDGERGWAQEKDLVFVGPPFEAPGVAGAPSS